MDAALRHFEHIVELRLRNNQLFNIEPHYHPRLRYLDLAFNELVLLLTTDSVY